MVTLDLQTRHIHTRRRWILNGTQLLARPHALVGRIICIMGYIASMERLDSLVVEYLDFLATTVRVDMDENGGFVLIIGTVDVVRNVGTWLQKTDGPFPFLFDRQLPQLIRNSDVHVHDNTLAMAYQFGFLVSFKC